MSEAFLVRRGGSGGGTGATLTVNAPVGATAKIVKDDKTKTKTVSSDGTAVFSGITGGQWLASISDATHDETTPVPVEVITDYSVTFAFFSATINITYPEGSTCTVSNGNITLNAPDTSGTWACTVPEAGTWTVSCTDGTKSTSDTASITAAGQTVSVKLSYILYIVSESDGLATGYSTAGSMRKSEKTVIIPENATAALSGYLKPAIDVTNYSTLHIDAYWGATKAGLGTAQDGTSFNAVVDPDSWSRETASIDLRSMSGLYYFKAQNQYYNTSIIIYNLWLTP